MSYKRPVDPKWPVSSRYGAKGPWWNWYQEPQTGIWRQGKLNGIGQHKGIDYAVPVGTPVYASLDGKIEMADWESPDHSQGFGLRIRQLFNPLGSRSIWRFYYAHLSELKVKTGDIVKAGDLLGFSGNTGHSSGPHLHIEIRNQYGQPQPIPIEERSA